MGSRNCRSAKQKVEKEKHREKEQPQRRRWVKTITICYENVLSFAFWFFRLNSHFLRIVVLLVCDLDTTFTTEKKIYIQFPCLFCTWWNFFLALFFAYVFEPNSYNENDQANYMTCWTDSTAKHFPFISCLFHASDFSCLFGHVSFSMP